MAQRLPFVNNDDGTWGQLLVDYLTKEHVDNGVLNSTNGGHKNVTITGSAAGAAGTAPLKFASGTKLVTAEAGVVEYDGSDFYISPSGTSRYKIVGDSYAQTLTNKTLDTGTVINTLPTGTAVSAGASVSTLAARDSNGNLFSRNSNSGISITSTTGATAIITAASNFFQMFTGGGTQVLQLPVTTSNFSTGMSYIVFNNGSGTVEIKASDSSHVYTLGDHDYAEVTCISTAVTTNAAWFTNNWNVGAADGKDVYFEDTFDFKGLGGHNFNFPAYDGTLGLMTDTSSIKVDYANEPATLSWSASSSTQTTAAFTPRAGTYVLVFLGIGTSSSTSSAIITDNHSNTYTKLSFLDTFDAAEIWGFYYTTSPGSTTITAALTSALHGGSLKVRSLLGANPIQNGASATAGNANQNVTITPTQTGSRIFGLTTDFTGTNLDGTQISGTEQLSHYNVTSGSPSFTPLDDVNMWQYTGTTVAGSALTLGYPTTGHQGNTVAIEIVGLGVTTNDPQILTNKTITSPKMDSIKDSLGSTILRFAATSAAVNNLGISNNVTTGTPSIFAEGPVTDPNVNIALNPKGAGVVQIYQNTGLTTATLTTDGTAAGVDLNLTTKGTNNHVQIKGFDAIAANSYSPAAKTSNYSIVATDHTFVYFADATSGAVTMTLPAASTVAGFRFDIKRIDGTGNIVMISSAGGTIDGSASVTLDAQYTSITVVSNGTNWYIL